MFSSDLLKQKTNQQLRLLCKEHGIPQYGDKATLICRILEQADHNEDPSDGGGDGDGVGVGDAIEQVDELVGCKPYKDRLTLSQQTNKQPKLFFSHKI